MANTNRDDFSTKTKETLALRVAYHCSNPNCKKLTVGPNCDIHKSTKTGEAAHIKAAAPGGPRYDSSMSPEERSDIRNGIWLCSSCADLIDKNPDSYPIELLYSWKQQSEEKARQEQTSEQINSSVIKTKYPRPENYTIQRKIISCNDLSENSFNYLDSDKTITLLDAVKQYNYIVLLGDAGDGKSLELSQLAYELSKSDDNIFPIKYNLNKYVGGSIDELLPENYGGKTLDKNLIFILDGFDEIQEKDINNFKRYIEKYCEDNPSTKFVISSRSNFYRQPSKENNFDGTIKNFKAFSICQLSNADIEDYVCSQHIDYKNFITKLNYNNLKDLAVNPFYLTALVDLYSENKKLPARIDLMDALIQSSFGFDKNKYKNTYDIMSDKNKLNQILKILGFTLQCLGKNYLDENEFQDILNKDDRSLLEYSGIWSKNNDDDWQFIHNNFGEYLAAKYLADMPLSKIITLITYNVDHTIIKPSWVNTLSYLTSLYKGSELLDWLSKYAPEKLIKFEKDKINDEDLRIQIFKKIVLQYNKKSLWIDNRNTIRDLIRFAGCKKTLEFLLDQIKETELKQTVFNCCDILRLFIKTYSLDKEIISVLLNCINKFGDQYISYRILLVFSSLKLQTEDLTRKLINKFQENGEEPQARIGMYEYLYTSEYLDVNIQFFLDGIILYNGERYNSDLFYSIYEGIKRINTIDAFNKVIIFFINILNQNEDWIYSNQEFIKILFNVAEKLYNKDSDIVFNLVYKLMFIVLKTGVIRDVKDDITNFFENTNTRVETFLKLAKDSKFEYKYYLIKIADNECIDQFIEQYQNKKICNETALEFANELNNYNNPKFNDLKKVIEQRTEQKIEYKQHYNYAQIKKEGTQKYFDALFDKGPFNELVKEVLKISGNDQLKIKDLLNFNFRRRYDLRLVKLAIYHNKQIKSRDILVSQFLQDIDWDIFSINEIYEQLKGENNTVQVSHKQIEYIKKYFYQKISEISLCTYSRMAYILIYFMVYFHFECNVKIYLDMLTFSYNIGKKIDDNNNNLVEYISKRVNSQKFNQKIIDNLINKNLGGIIYENHIQYCIDNKIYDVVEIAKQVCIDPARDEWVKRTSIDYLVMLIEEDELDKEDFYCNVVEKVDDKILLYVSERLYKSGDSELIVILEERVEQSDIKDELMAYLIYLNTDTGIDYYINLLKTSMKTPSRSLVGENMTKAIGTISDIIKLPKMLQLLDLLFDDEFKDCEFASLWSNLQKSLLLMGEKNQANYEQVKSNLTARLSNPQIKENEKRFINSTLDLLKDRYLENGETALTIDDVKELIQTI